MTEKEYMSDNIGNTEGQPDGGQREESQPEENEPVGAPHPGTQKLEDLMKINRAMQAPGAEPGDPAQPASENASPSERDFRNLPYDQAKIIEEMGFKEQWESLPGEGRRKLENNLNAIGNPEGHDPDNVFNAAKELGIPADRFEDMLRTRGYTPEEIAEILKDDRRSELPDDISDEAREEIPEAEGIIDGAKGLIAEAKGLENATDDEKAAFKKKADGKIHEWLYGDNGLISRGKIGSRLFIKPGVAVLLALLLFYVSCLHIGTNWATKRIGGGK